MLRAGQHPFIKHDTCVQYPGALVVTDTKLEQFRKAGKLRMKQPLDSEVLNLIRQQTEASQISLAAYEILRRQGLVP